jgi:hypothetical protein
VNTQQIELKGHTFEVQTQAVVTSTIRIGDKLRILKKSTYSEPKVYDGVVVGFEPFKDLPSIVIAYFENETYSSPDLKFLVWNEKTKDCEITQAIADPLKNNARMFDKAMQAKAAKLRMEAQEIDHKLAYFRAHFGMQDDLPLVTEDYATDEPVA